MPAIKEQHTANYYANVERVVETILDDPTFLDSKRGAALRERVMKLLKVSEPQAKRYIVLARKQVMQGYAADNEENRRKAVLRYEGIIRRAQDQGNLKSEIEAVKQLNILLGLGQEVQENRDMKVVIEQVIIDKRG